MSEKVFTQIKEGLEEALAVAKGEGQPARVHTFPRTHEAEMERQAPGYRQRRAALKSNDNGRKG